MSSKPGYTRRPISAMLLGSALVGASVVGANMTAVGADGPDTEGGYVPPPPPLASQVSPPDGGGVGHGEFLPPLVVPAPVQELDLGAEAQVESEPEPASEPVVEVTPTELPASGGDFGSRVFDAVNQLRIAGGLPPLVWSACAGSSAANWSANLASRGSFHRDVRAACPPAFAVGKNLVTGHGSAEDLIAAWGDSSGDVTNLLNPTFTQLGVGCSDVNAALATTCALVFLGM